MKIATTTEDFAPYFECDIERIKALHRAGFRYVDLNMGDWNPTSVYMQDDWQNYVMRLKEEAAKLGVTFVQAHSPFGNALSKDESHVEFLVAATLRSIEVCAHLGIKNTVVHFGTAEGVTKEEWFERNKAFYDKLLPLADTLGVNILIENSTKINMGDKYWTNSGKEMLEFLRFVGHPNLHACWDTGHANCEGAQYDDIMTLGEELYAIHYHDNHGTADEHLIPFFGTMNHDEVINALVDSGFARRGGYFTLEATSSLVAKKAFPKSRRVFDRDERLAEPQIFMQDTLEKFLYDTAKYMLSSYGLFEE